MEKLFCVLLYVDEIKNSSHEYFASIQILFIMQNSVLIRLQHKNLNIISGKCWIKIFQNLKLHKQKYNNNKIQSIWELSHVWKNWNYYDCRKNGKCSKNIMSHYASGDIFKIFIRDDSLFPALHFFYFNY